MNPNPPEPQNNGVPAEASQLPFGLRHLEEQASAWLSVVAALQDTWAWDEVSGVNTGCERAVATVKRLVEATEVGELHAHVNAVTDPHNPCVVVYERNVTGSGESYLRHDSGRHLVIHGSVEHAKHILAQANRVAELIEFLNWAREACGLHGLPSIRLMLGNAGAVRSALEEKRKELKELRARVSAMAEAEDEIDKIKSHLGLAEVFGTAASVRRLLSELEASSVTLQAKLAETNAALYVPGGLKCAKCGFVQSKAILHVKSGTIAADLSQPELCPNDGSPMRRVTWQEQAQACSELACAEIGRLSTVLHAHELHPDYVYKTQPIPLPISAPTPPGPGAEWELNTFFDGSIRGVVMFDHHLERHWMMRKPPVQPTPQPENAEL